MPRLAVLAFCVLLSGCFSSDGPLFADTRGQCPFATPTIYEEVDEHPARFLFARDGANCVTTDEQGKQTRTLFVPIGGDWWIVQGADPHPSYMLIHRSGGRLIQYAPPCHDFSASRLSRLGVTYDDERRECTATQARQIETLFRAWRYGWFHQPGDIYREMAPGTVMTPASSPETPTTP